MSKHSLLATAMAVMIPVLSACGGGSPSAAAVAVPVPVEALVPADPALDGYTTPTSAHTALALITMGDSPADGTFVGFISFDLSGIGPVQAAEISIHGASTFGTPWDLGPLIVDHIDVGPALDQADSVAPALEEEIHVLNEDTSWTLDVGDQVAADVAAGRTHSTFRLRFAAETDGDGTQDAFRIGATEHINEDIRPTLLVTHLP